ncbi:MAG TPA: DUF2971 domain-containing protein [Candidatus Acidoferrales bacterium]|nr:DUF2971 domain-containing protein [Candidatus Acidoferrales bacterium]
MRFSQRSVFEDDHELQPEYAMFGTRSEIWRFAIAKGIRLSGGGLPAGVIVEALVGNARHQKLMIETLKNNVHARDEIGSFCVTEAIDSQRMWSEYAANDTGFAIGFDTNHAEFKRLSTPGKFGKVFYSDEPVGSALASLLTNEAAGDMFRKRMKYAFEREWRIVRLLRRLELHGAAIFMSPFNPLCVSEIIIRPRCSVEDRIRLLVREDARYNHVKVKRLDDQLN